MDFQYTLLSVRAGYMEPKWGVKYRDERLTIYSDGRPESDGWTIHRGDHMIIRGSDGAARPWNGEGLIGVMEEESGHPMSAANRRNAVPYFDRLCKDWSTGKTCFVGRVSGDEYTNIYDDNRSGRYDVPPSWLPPVLTGLFCLVLAIAIHFTAKATMGSTAVSGLDS